MDYLQITIYSLGFFVIDFSTCFRFIITNEVLIFNLGQSFHKCISPTINSSARNYMISGTKFVKLRMLLLHSDEDTFDASVPSLRPKLA